MWNRVKPYVISVLAALAAGGLSALLSGNIGKEYGELIKPPLSPPGWVFPVVWTILYVLMGIAAAFVWVAGRDGAAPEEQVRKALRVYVAQLVVNIIWPVLFFRLELRLLSFFWLLLLVVLVLVTRRRFRAISQPAGDMLIPYILWLLFAGYLNLATYILNG